MIRAFGGKNRCHYCGEPYNGHSRFDVAISMRETIGESDPISNGRPARTGYSIRVCRECMLFIQGHVMVALDPRARPGQREQRAA